MSGVLVDVRDALAARKGLYLIGGLQRLRIALEGLDSSLQECEADMHDEHALYALEAALTEALEGE